MIETPTLLQLICIIALLAILLVSIYFLVMAIILKAKYDYIVESLAKDLEPEGKSLDDFIKN